MTTILALPDEIMEEIFLRLDAAVDLVRASAVCPSHRRVVCNRRFVRRYRLLHPPAPVVGLLESMGIGGILHAEPPHQSAPAAISVVQAADFTLSFLPVEPNTFPWRICDARDGRVLLSRRSADVNVTFLELLICDPLYRRYLQIPSIPEDIWPKRYSAEMESEPFLLPVPAREEEDESQFRVIYNWLSCYRIVSFLFDSASTENSKWSVATSFSLLPDRPIHDPKILVRHRYYVGSCFYWVHRNVEHMLVLDTLGMNFSITGLPEGNKEWNSKRQAVVVDAGVNRIGLAVLGPKGNLDIYSKSWQNNGGSAEEWQHDKRHQLPKGYAQYCISGAAEGCLLLLGWRLKIQTVQYFKLDLKTFQVEKFCKSRDALYQAVPYARFPPSLLSPPSI